MEHQIATVDTLPAAETVATLPAAETVENLPAAESFWQGLLVLGQSPSELRESQVFRT